MVCLFVFMELQPIVVVFFTARWRALASSFSRFLDHTQDAPQSVGLLWTSDKSVAETSTWHTQHSQQTNIHSPGGIRTHNLSRRAAEDLRLRSRGHWDRKEYGKKANVVSKLVLQNLACNPYIFIVS
jgi:hypothetical protein